MLGATAQARGQPKRSSKNGLKNGLKVERGEEDEDSSDDSGPDDADLDLELSPQGEGELSCLGPTRVRKRLAGGTEGYTLVVLWVVVLMSRFRRWLVLGSFVLDPRPVLVFDLVFHAGEGGLLAKEDIGRYAGELLMPLMKSIYSNADK